MSGSQDLRCRPLSIRIPLENCARTPAAHSLTHAPESTSFAGQLLLRQQYRAVVDGMGGARGPTSRFFARIMRIASEKSFVFVNGVHAANFSFVLGGYQKMQWMNSRRV